MRCQPYATHKAILSAEAGLKEATVLVHGFVLVISVLKAPPLHEDLDVLLCTGIQRITVGVFLPRDPQNDGFPFGFPLHTTKTT